MGLSEAERTAAYRIVRPPRRAGRSREVVATLRRRAPAPPFDSAVWVEIESLEEHEAHPRSDGFGYRGRPPGRGAVTGAMRWVIDRRRKGDGISGREENAEAMGRRVRRR